MKRCNVCGNIGDDECTVCSICGNPLTEADVIAEQDGEPVPEEKSAPDLIVTSEEMVASDRKISEPVPLTQNAAASAKEAAVSARAAAESAREAAASAEKAAASAKVAASQPETASLKETEPMKEKSAADTSEPSASENGAEDVSQQPSRTVETGQRRSGQAESVAFSAQRTESAAASAQRPESAAASAQRPEGAASSAQRPVRTRRTRSGPQIYGQDSVAGYNGAQGVIRRDVQGGHTTGGVQGASQADVRRDTGTSRRAERGNAPSVQNRPSEAGNVRPLRSGPAADMRQDRVAEPQPNVSGGASNAQPGAPANRTVPAQGQAQRAGVPPYVQVPQGDRQQAIKITTARKVMETAREALASPMLIIIALFYTVYFVSNIAAIFLRQLNFSQIARLLTMFSFPSQLSGYISMFQAAMAQLDKGALALNLLIRVPELLFCIGLWLLIVLVRTADEQMSGAGFLLMKISVIITMIAACGILLVVLVVSVTLVIAAWSAGTQSVIAVAAVTLVATIVVTMAVLMYYFCYLATIKTVRKSARNGEQYGKASAYVAVIHIIFAFTGIINILSGIVNLEITGITCGAAQIGWMVLFGIWILRYRSSLSEYAE